ncbi:glycosyltransferase family 2 protein [Candidatus Binatus sp.]|uniref:glycosyltransferase family 2 protein n=1 Tax=Candidatus Binatus sp. TaxID=2811406 RepID=UPI003C400268
MSTGSKISIAMAVYNGDRFIGEQLESFVRQTRVPDVLVVSDNASTDRTVEIVRDFAARAPFPVRLFINDSNLGGTKNFERAIRECTGDIIFLSDCDDVWYPNKVSVMEQALAESPRAGVTVSDADLVDEHLEPLGGRLWPALGFRYRSRDHEKLIAGSTFNRRVPTTGCCLAFRARFKPLVLPLPDGYLHDIFIAWTIMCSGVGGVALVPMALIAYRQHSNQTTRITRGAKSDEPDPGLFAQRFASRKERPIRALAPVITRLESAYQRDDANKKLLSAVLRHWRARCELPAGRFERLPVIFRELATLRYWRFSDGISTAVKDLIFVH